jgi:hypothetical protein
LCVPTFEITIREIWSDSQVLGNTWEWQESVGYLSFWRLRWSRIVDKDLHHLVSGDHSKVWLQSICFYYEASNPSGSCNGLVISGLDEQIDHWWVIFDCRTRYIE